MAFGSLFSSSSSADSRGAETGQQTGGDGSPALSLSNVEVKRGSDLDLNVSLSDYGAIEAALQYGGEASMSALDYGNAALDAALTFAGEGGAAAFDLVENNNDLLGQVTRTAINDVVGLAATSIQSGESLSRAAIDEVRGSQRDSFEFVAGGVERAFDAAETAQSAVDAIANRSLESVEDAYGSAAEYTQAAYITALDVADRSAQRQSQAFETATNAIEDANQSETAKLGEQLVYAVIGLVALMAWRAAR